MIGIGYFADKNNEYMAEMQVKAIKESIANIDDVMLLKEDSDFSGEKLDNMIETAAANKCDNLILLTEEENYNVISQAVPQIYEGMFDSITVMPENFTRIKEVGETVTQPAAPAAGNTQANDVKEQVQTKIPSSAAPKPNMPTYILCDAIHLNIAKFKEFSNFVASIKNSKAIKNNPIDPSKIKIAFISSDSARIDGGSMQSLMQAFPKKYCDFSKYIKEFDNNVPDFSEQTDGTLAIQTLINNAGIKVVKTKDENGNEQSTNEQDPTVTAVNVIAPTKIANKLLDAINKNNLNASVFHYDDIGGQPTFEHPKNAEIAKMFEELLHTDKELDKNGHNKEDWDEVNKKGKNNEDAQIIVYIRTIMKAMNEWGKADHKKPRAKADTQSALEKALKDLSKQLLDVNGIKNDLNGTVFGTAVDAAVKLGKATKADMDKLTKDNTEKLFDEKKTGDRNPVNIFMWSKYEQLKKDLLGQN